MTQANERDRWLSLDDDALVAQCKVDNYRASGPGGQHRNKVSSAVRLRHEPSGVVAHAEESRSQHENKKRAIRRLRLEIALNVRAKVATNLRADAAAKLRTNSAASLRTDATAGLRSDAATRAAGGRSTPLPGKGGAGGGSRAPKNESHIHSLPREEKGHEADSDVGDLYAGDPIARAHTRSADWHGSKAVRCEQNEDATGRDAAASLYEPPAVFLQYRTKAGRVEVSTKNHDFALVVAAVLDVLAARMGSLKEAAALLGVSTSQLSRFITSEPPILRAANRIREQHGLKHLTTGS